MKPIPLLQLLRLLHEETDEQHTLTQQNILSLMEQRYEIHLNRRTLKTYLDALSEMGVPLHWTEVPRMGMDGKTEMLRTDWYLEAEFENSEIRLLLDLLAAVPAIPERQRKELEEKLCRYGSPSFRKQTSTAPVICLHTPAVRQLMYSVDQLCTAMAENRKVCFEYCHYVLDEDGKPALVPRCREDGSVREYIVSPYRIIMAYGKYYLVCCKMPHMELSHYRIDRIQEIHLLEEERIPLSAVMPPKEEGRQDPILPQYAAEHLYMYSGPSVPCVLEADVHMLGDLIDWFGQDIEVEPSKNEGKLCVKLRVHPVAMQHWALQYGSYVTVLEPESLRDKLAEITRELAERYQQQEQEETN